MRTIAIMVLTATLAGADETLELTPVQDAYVCDCLPDVTNPNGGPNFLYQGQYGSCFDRTLIQWDLSQIPAGATIVSAEMRLWCEAFYGTQSGAPVCYLIEEPWDESTVTFNTQPAWSAAVTATGSWPVADEWHVVDVTGFVQAWCSGAEENYGIYCHSASTTGTCVPGFYSSNWADESLRPSLVVVYWPQELEQGSWGSIKVGE
jgi:hypothetical protein